MRSPKSIWSLLIGFCLIHPVSGRDMEPHILWDFAIGKDNAIQSRPSVAQDGTIYFGAFHKRLYALHPDGSLKWEWRSEGGVHTCPTIAPDGTVYIGYFDDSMAAIGSAGNWKWGHPVAIPHQSAITVAPGGDVYLVGSHSSKPEYADWRRALCALDARGTRKWKVDIGEPVERCSPVLDSNHNILTLGIVQTHYGLYSVCPEGSLNWIYPDAGTDAGVGPNGEIYVATSKHSLVRLASTGKVVWETDLKEQATCAPVVDSLGNIYVGTNDGYLYSLREDGRVRWIYESTAIAILCGTMTPEELAREQARTRRRHPEFLASPVIDASGSIVFGIGDQLISLKSDGKINFTLSVSDETAGSISTGIAVGPGPSYYFGVANNGSEWRLVAVGLTPRANQREPSHWSAPPIPGIFPPPPPPSPEPELSPLEAKARQELESSLLRKEMSDYVEWIRAWSRRLREARTPEEQDALHQERERARQDHMIRMNELRR